MGRGKRGAPGTAPALDKRFPRMYNVVSNHSAPLERNRDVPPICSGFDRSGVPCPKPLRLGSLPANNGKRSMGRAEGVGASCARLCHTAGKEDAPQ